MNADDRRRLATMVDIIARESTTPAERAAAISRVAAITNGKSITDVVNEMFADVGIEVPTYIPQVNKNVMAWRDWKAKHEETVLELERLKRRNATLEAPRFAKSRVKPDAEGYVPFPTFLIALLAVRDWYVQDIFRDLGDYAQIDQQEIKSWRERGKVPYHYYEMLDKLPFGVQPSRKETKTKWTEQSEAMLREYFSAAYVLSDFEIAKEMSQRLGFRLTQHAVHCKADDLGLLRNIKRAGRRLKTGRGQDAAEQSQHTPDSVQ